MIRTERLDPNKEHVYTSLFSFLDLDASKSLEAIERITADSRRVGYNAVSHQIQMLPETRRLLERFYLPFEKALNRTMKRHGFPDFALPL